MTRERARAWQSRHHEKYKAMLRAFKEGRPCADCDNVFPPVCMDWDHRPGTVKLFNIADGHHGLTTLLAEMAKCDLVCANCHRIRTEARGKA